MKSLPPEVVLRAPVKFGWAAMTSVLLVSLPQASGEETASKAAIDPVVLQRVRQERPTRGARHPLNKRPDQCDDETSPSQHFA